nr:ubinuclein-2-like isoform X3 [Tanacetum cinerariifolium]
MTHGLMLENAILEMEIIVADSIRVHGDIQDVDHPVATKSRLPCEVKQKLEIVARLA